MNPSLPLMYDWVRRTRERLFEYTESLPSQVYVLKIHAVKDVGKCKCVFFTVGELNAIVCKYRMQLVGNRLDKVA